MGELVKTVLELTLSDPALIQEMNQKALEEKGRLLRKLRIRAGGHTCDGLEGAVCPRRVSANKRWCMDCYKLMVVKLRGSP